MARHTGAEAVRVVMELEEPVVRAGLEEVDEGAIYTSMMRGILRTMEEYLSQRTSLGVWRSMGREISLMGMEDTRRVGATGWLLMMACESSPLISFGSGPPC